MKTLKHIALVATTAVAATALVTCAQPEHYDFDHAAALETCHQQVERALQQLEADSLYPTHIMPRNIGPNGIAWDCRPVCAEEWCTGFWPGILWLDLMNHPTDSHLRKAAINATLALEPILDRPVLDHDLGFLFFCSAGTGIRVLQHIEDCMPLSEHTLAANHELIGHFSQMLLRAADSLATLYRPNVGTILSWPRNVQKFGGHNTIMDNMINLELLFWAAENGGSKELAEIAAQHALTTMKHHFRPDGTTYHVAVYDSIDGHFLRGVTHQGLADSSMWARGQAWAVYGFTIAYRETGHRKFLDTALKAADVFVSRLPDDQVPLWDFMAPSDAPRDASAAAIVASALLELSSFNAAGPKVTKQCRRQAVAMLESLTQHYSAAGTNPAFLLHSVGNHPNGSEIDYSIVYADYYYLEALARLNEILNLEQ